MDLTILALLAYLKAQGVTSVSPQTDRPSYEMVTKEFIETNFKMTAIGVCYNGVIYLVKGEVDLSTVYGKSVLLHELVHYTQNYCPRSLDFAMWEAREHPAYQLQNSYLRDHGAPMRALMPNTEIPEYYERPTPKHEDCGIIGCTKVKPEDADAIKKRFDNTEKKNKRNWKYRFEENIL